MSHRLSPSSLPSLSLSGPIAQFPLGKQLLAKGCSLHSHIGLFLVENLHWANSWLTRHDISFLKNTIRDRRSTALYTVYTVCTVNTA